ncbi:MAG: tRNA (N(6)-L-threonylcarbamoyladenosine(37)-C(2))-methylthiotransferase MtaB [Flavobacteriales bacterium]
MNEFQRVAFYTLGCKLNFSETSTISRLFEDGGFAKVDFEANPDVFVINTCSVTENADKKCKQLVKRAKKISPDSMVIILGCYAQLKPEEISKIPGVDLVLGANEKFNVLEHLEQKRNESTGATIVHQNIKHTHDFIPSHSYGDRTRSFLKVQDGCDYFCTFCTIPLARGKSRNASIEETLKEAQKIAATEVKEVVLTGVNIGDFGQGGPENFFGLVKALDQVDGIDRFRISSIEPNLLSNEIIEYCLKNAQRFAPHFHIPLQSGSDEILEKMRRKYRTELFQNRIEQIKAINPDTCIGVDVIVGFPGETDANFLETMHFLKDLDISYLHVFTYSERANTGAPKLGTKVPMEVRRERSKQLHLLSERKKQAFYQTQIGLTKKVLFEQEENEGFLYGFTENYVKVKTPFAAEFINQIVTVKITEIDRDGLAKCVILANFAEN